DVESRRVDRFATYDPKQGGFSSRAQLSLELKRDEAASESTKPSSWSISPYVVLRSLELRSNFTGFLTDSVGGDSTQQRNDATTFGATASYRRELRLLSTHDALEAGISVRTDSIEQSQHRLSRFNSEVTDDTLTPGVQAKVRASSAAAYLDAAVHPLRRVTLRGGLRADGLSYLTEDGGGKSGGQNRSALGAQLSKRGTLDVVLMPGLDAVASYGEGFRSPQARSLSDGETTPFTRVVSYEGGLRFHDGKRLQSQLAVYRTRLSDDLVFDQSTARNELVPGTTRIGVAANLVAQPNAWFVSSTSFTYTHAAFSESDAAHAKGDLLPYVPQIVMRSDLALTPRLGRLWDHDVDSHFGLGLSYLARRPLPYAQLGHDVFLADSRASVRVGPVETGVEVFNLLNADWYDGEFVYASAFSGAASLVPIRHVTVGPPRGIFWSLSLRI
ncbi:MAG TPA: TonB-dependent receptor, partial [Polyangiaceae bacterium]|nr:TonB-dependent receptor [Polyangiaceae bacterium]